ncbi:MAG: hypothetical protein EBZ77_08750, partial [Chitinophagia bacterium]|nr:hypothetical protein [Chitinophagia bacterium]
TDIPHKPTLRQLFEVAQSHAGTLKDSDGAYCLSKYLLNAATEILAATTPSDASKVYSKNVLNFLKLIIDKEGGIQLNFEDDIVKGTCIAHNGAVVNERVAALLTA